MSACASPFDPMAAALSLACELRTELGAKGVDRAKHDAMSLDALADLLECPPHVVRGILDGKGACARVVCTLKDRVSGGGGLDGARRHKREEMARIAARQAVFIEQIQGKMDRGEIKVWSKEEA